MSEQELKVSVTALNLAPILQANVSHFPSWAPDALERCEAGLHEYASYGVRVKVGGYVVCTHCGKYARVIE